MLPLQSFDSPHKAFQDSNSFCHQDLNTSANNLIKTAINDIINPAKTNFKNDLTDGSNVKVLSEFSSAGHKNSSQISDPISDTWACHLSDTHGPNTASCCSSDGVNEAVSSCFKSLESSGQSSDLLDHYAKSGLTCRYHDDSEGDEGSVEQERKFCQ